MIITIMIIIIITITIIVIIIIMVSTAIFQNITGKLEKITYFVFLILEMLLPKVFYDTHG